GWLRVWRLATLSKAHGDLILPSELHLFPGRYQVWPHKLRHTYATHTLVTLQRNRATNKIEPLAFLQMQLGHASIQTTMVYLHLINELADEAVLIYAEELDELAGMVHG
ncbi:tyrosine-type recombinase/integrase, partial [Halomonas alkalicola]